jgi:ABC-2 type transport system ATP-binding protein
VLIINQGRIVGQGRPDELRAAARGDVDTIELEIRDPDRRAAPVLADVDGVRNVGDPVDRGGGLTAFTLDADPGVEVRERIFDTAVATGFKIVGLRSKTLSLEDIFVQITTREDNSAAPKPTRDEEGAQ